jgi:hypothetical protein
MLSFSMKQPIPKLACHAEDVSVALRLHREGDLRDGRTAANLGPDRRRDGVRPGDDERVHVDAELIRD